MASFPMMKRACIALVCVLITTHCLYGREDPSPLLVVTKTSPHGLLVNYHIPQCVVYSDGTIVYLSAVEGPRIYRYVNINADHLFSAVFPDRFAERLSELDPYTELTDSSDQPLNVFAYWSDKGPRLIKIYGVLMNDRKRDSSSSLEPPKVISELMLRLADICKDGNIWKPDTIELIAWPYETTNTSHVPWPGSVPKPASAKSNERSPNMCAVRISFENVAKVEEMRKMTANGHPIESDGRVWAVTYRVVFPSEEKWEKLLHKG